MNNAWREDFALNIAGPCTTYQESDDEYRTYVDNPNNYHFYWFAEYDLGHKFSIPYLVDEGVGVDSIETAPDTLYVPNGARFRLTVQAEKLSSGETGMAYIGVEGIDNPYVYDIITNATCGAGNDVHAFPFEEDVDGPDDDEDIGSPSWNDDYHKCYVRGCNGGRTYHADAGGGGGATVTTDTCPR